MFEAKAAVRSEKIAINYFRRTTPTAEFLGPRDPEGTLMNGSVRFKVFRSNVEARFFPPVPRTEVERALRSGCSRGSSRGCCLGAWMGILLTARRAMLGIASEFNRRR